MEELAHGHISCTRDENHKIQLLPDDEYFTCPVCGSSTEKWCIGCQRFYPTSTFNSFHISHTGDMPEPEEEDNNDNTPNEPIFVEVDTPSVPSMGSLNVAIGDENQIVVESPNTPSNDYDIIEENIRNRIHTSEEEDEDDNKNNNIEDKKEEKVFNKVKQTEKTPEFPKTEDNDFLSMIVPKQPKFEEYTNPQNNKGRISPSSSYLHSSNEEEEDEYYEENQSNKIFKKPRLIKEGEVIISDLDQSKSKKRIDEEDKARPKVYMTKSRFKKLQDKKRRNSDSSSSSEEEEEEGESEESEESESESEESESSESSDSYSEEEEDDDDEYEDERPELESIKEKVKNIRNFYKIDGNIDFSTKSISTTVNEKNVFKAFKTLLFKEIRDRKIPFVRSRSFQGKSFAMMRIFDPLNSKFRIIKNIHSFNQSPMIVKSMYYSSKWLSAYQKFKKKFQKMYREMYHFSKGFQDIEERVPFHKIKGEFFNRPDFLYLLPLGSHRMKFDLWNTIGVVYVLICYYEGIEFVFIGSADRGIGDKWFNSRLSHLNNANRILKDENDKRMPKSSDLVFRLCGSNSYLFVIGDFKMEKYSSVKYWVRKYRKLSLKFGTNTIVVNEEINDLPEKYTFILKRKK